MTIVKRKRLAQGPAKAPTSASPPGTPTEAVLAGGDPSTPTLAYMAALPDWQIARDLLAGARQIREKGEAYLPKFAKESKEAYDARRKHSPFVNHYRDHLETIVSKPFTKEVAMQGDVTKQMLDFSHDVDGHGVSLHKFARDAFKEAIGFGVVGLLVDYTPLPQGATLADERAAGSRPYWAMYRAEDILALYTDQRAGHHRVVHVRLAEDTIKRIGFSERPVRRVRILNDDGEGRTWELWESDGKGWLQIAAGDISLPELPFRVFKPGEREWWTNATASPLVDLAYLQIEHYQQSANLKHVLELTGFPMLSGKGITPEIDKDTGLPKMLMIGPDIVCYAPVQPGVTTLPSWEFIEPGGDSVNGLQSEIGRIEQQMAKIGKAPLIRNVGGLTATSEAVNAAKAHAAAEAWAIDLKDAMEQMFVFTCMWWNETKRPNVYIHTDFGVDLRESQENTELMLAVDKNLLSIDSCWDEWRRRGFFGPQFEPERERARIAADRALRLRYMKEELAVQAQASGTGGGGPKGNPNGGLSGNGNFGKRALKNQRKPTLMAGDPQQTEANKMGVA